MKIAFWSIGKANESFVLQGIEEFTKRIANYYKVHWEIIPNLKLAAHLSPAELKKKEASVILSKLQQDDFLVLLDERGKQISSEDFAKFLENKAATGVKNLIFLIGGAYGVDDAIFKRSNYTLGFSKFVFPHQLVRLILVEQVYRACTIIKNEKYHHS